MPKYKPEADLSGMVNPREPTLKICSMSNGNLALPRDIREKWLNDPVRSDLEKDHALSLCYFFVSLAKNNTYFHFV